MSKETWHKGYQEVRNVIHNEMGITREEILEIFREIAKVEIQNIVSENKPFIYQVIKNIIKKEMMGAVEGHNYPKISNNFWNYSQEHSFKDFIIGVMKEEIVESMRKEFDFKLDIEKKSLI